MTQKLVIIDYGSGNLRSVAKAFERVAPAAQVMVSSDPAQLVVASHIVLPGVGAFADCMAGLLALPDMLSQMQEQVLAKKKPFLGICVGMQMLFERGHEHGVHNGLGWLAGEVVAIPADAGLKVPHMGWNELEIKHENPLLNGISTGDHAYFVHSYHALAKSEDIIATTNYGAELTAAVAKGNIWGTQFHPEKSQKTGLKLLKNFINL